jgi:hypothetical protein
MARKREEHHGIETLNAEMRMTHSTTREGRSTTNRKQFGGNTGDETGRAYHPVRKGKSW